MPRQKKKKLLCRLLSDLYSGPSSPSLSLSHKKKKKKKKKKLQPSPGSKRFSAASFASAASSARSQQPPFEDFLVLKDQSPPPPPVTDLFTLGRVLGRGAFGVTRLARERATGDAVAIKTIARRRIAAHLPDHAERVQCEVEAMWRVSGHPHIVALKSCHEDEKGVHLAMVSFLSFFWC